jgi:hypothetical protein
MEQTSKEDVTSCIAKQVAVLFPWFSSSFTRNSISKARDTAEAVLGLRPFTQSSV